MPLPLAAVLGLAVLATAAGCGGGARSLTASPSRVDFGEVPFEAEPAEVRVTVVNKGRSAVRMYPARIDGDTPAKVAATSTCTDGKRLSPAGSCTVVVSLQADRFGLMKGTLHVLSSEKELVIPVTATGGGTVVVRVPTRSIHFARPARGASPARGFVVLVSRGTAAAYVDTYTIEGSDSDDFRIAVAGATCALSQITPGTTCRLPIVFTPSALATRHATVVLTADDRTAAGSLIRHTFRVYLTG